MGAGPLPRAGRDARREELAIPSPVIVVRDGAGVLALQHPADASLHGLVGLPVSARRHSIALLPVLFIRLRIPCAAADALDQLRRDAIPLESKPQKSLLRRRTHAKRDPPEQ